MAGLPALHAVGYIPTTEYESNMRMFGIKSDDQIDTLLAIKYVEKGYTRVLADKRDKSRPRRQPR